MIHNQSEIIESNPIGNRLDGFRRTLHSTYKIGAPDSLDGLDVLAIQDLENLTFELLSALQALPACRLLGSKDGRKNLLGDLLQLISRIDSGAFDYGPVIPLLKAVISQEPDENIWTALYEAVTLCIANPTSLPHPSPTERHDFGVPDNYLLPDGYPDYFRLIVTSRVYDVLEETPLIRAVNISARLECNVLLKREDLHPTFSCKLRGAYNKMSHLGPAQSWRGVVTSSTGNHGLAVAYSGRKLRVPTTVVMPEGTPPQRIIAVTRLGGNVVLRGENLRAAADEARRFRIDKIDIPPFDDPYVIAGQGTIGMEIVRQTHVGKLEAIFCCIGGGGLISGIGVYIKRMAPSVKVIGVQTCDSNAMAQSLKIGQPVSLAEVGIFSGDAAVERVGDETFRICQEVVDDIILVTTDEACAAIKDIFDDTRSIVEPAGALALAGLKKYVRQNPSPNSTRSLVAVVSGANMDFDRLGFIAERAVLGDQKEALLSIAMPEKPDAVSKLINVVYPMRVMEINYRSTQDGSANAIMTVSLDARSRGQDLENLLQRLKEEDMAGTDLSHNELAKSHIRYMVGGRSRAPGERLFAFEFPERRGAFYKFLRDSFSRFSISLLHYVNRNSDVGRVMVGIQCSESEQKLELFQNLKCQWREETENPAYTEFLRC